MTNDPFLPSQHCELLLLPSWDVVSPSGQEVQDSTLLLPLYVPIGQIVHPVPSL